MHSQRFRKPREGDEYPSEYDFDSRLIQDEIARNPQPFVKTTLNLATAGSLTLRTPGRGFVPYFFLTSTTLKTRALTALLSISVNDDGNDSSKTWTGKHNRGYVGTFATLTLSWTAQANTSVDFVVFKSKSTPWQLDDIDPGATSSFVVTGTLTTPSLVTTTITTVSTSREMIFLAGNGGPQTLSGSPQITNGVRVGDELLLVGTSDTNTVTVQNADNVSVNGNCVLSLDSYLRLNWNGTYWFETGRVESV